MDTAADLEVSLGEEALGQRVDRALVEALARHGLKWSRSQLARAFAAGQVRRQGRPLKPSQTVDAPWTVQVRLVAPEPLRADPEDLPLVVVHEDEHVLVLDKPAGMVVHPGPGHPRGSLVAAVLHHLGAEARDLPVMPGNDLSRPGVVHRLDKDTSGLIVFTKTMPAQAALADQFQRHDIDRAYLGIVLGSLGFEMRVVETSHGRDPADRRRFSPEQGHRRAITEVSVTERMPSATVARFMLQTGRTHQIRMHARHLGHPIFGDDLYGRAPRDARRRELWTALRRHALHAYVLGFQHPHSGTRLRFESPLPPDLVALRDALRQPRG